ncbi:MAG: oligosaccharide flippase family protein [Candidatus Micrarchaeota archaeon]|nr:oligosaccharide flippase family protein [Candidatus Micrarchaeota archaeon]MDE1864440.1 oligosaccharide flippase family protein [Candidatus Micrarchaeota archaeon]
MAFEKESIGRRATRTFFASVTGKVLALIITTVTLIAVARLLGPSSYGVYTVAIGYSALIGAVAQFGIASYFDRNISYMSYKRDAKGMGQVIGNGYVIIIAIAIVLMSVGIALSGYLPGTLLSNSGIKQLTLILVSVDLFFTTIWGASYSALIGFGKGRNASIDLVLLGSVQLIVGVGLIYQGFGVNGAVSGILLGDMLGFLLTSYHTYSALKDHGRIMVRLPNISGVRNTLIFALPLAANNFLLNGVSNFGVLFLSAFAPAYILGNFGTALKGLAMMSVVYGTLAIVLIQSFSTIIHVKKSRDLQGVYNKTITYSLLLNLPMVAFVAVFSAPLIYLLLTSKFSLAPLYLLLIALGTSIGIMNSFTSSFFVASGKTGKLMKISLVAVLIQLFFLVVLVPAYGAVGAIVALYIIGSITTFALFARGLLVHFKIKPDYRKLLNLFVANAAMGMLLLPILMIHGYAIEIALGIAGVLLLYPPLLVLFRAIDSVVLRNVEHLVEMMPGVRHIVRQFGRYTGLFIRYFDLDGG